MISLIYNMIVELPRHNGSEFTLEQFCTLTRQSIKPFVVTNCQFLNQSQFETTAIHQTTPLSSFDSDLENYVYHDLVTIQKQFENDQLIYNYFDTPVDYPVVMDQNWLQKTKERLDKYDKHKLTWIWTQKNRITGFHQDPPYQGCGGWMQLFKGLKRWWLLSDTDFQKLDLPLSRLNQMSSDDLLNFATDTEIHLYTTLIKERDLLWFPKNTVHRVETIHSSYGFGGYF